MKHNNSNTLGLIAIDYGTTNTAVAWMKANATRPGTVELQASRHVRARSKSIETVFRCDEFGEIEEYGAIAYNRKDSLKNTTYYNFKPELTNPENIEAYKLSQKWLELLNELIKQSLNRDNLDDFQFVIGHPVKWDPKSQLQLLKIAKEAGFKNIKSVREPIGAALYLESVAKKELPEGKSLIIDFGGGTIDFVLIEVQGRKVKTLCAGGNDRIGGRDIDDLIYEHLKDKYSLRFDKLSPISVELKVASRYLKVQLSEKTNESYFSTNVDNQSVELEKKELKSLCKPIFKQIEQNLLDFLKNDGDIIPEELSSIIFCGGSSKLLGFQSFIESLLSCKSFNKIKDSDDIIVKGLARVDKTIEKYTNLIARRNLEDRFIQLIKNVDTKVNKICHAHYIAYLHRIKERVLIESDNYNLEMEAGKKQFAEQLLKNMAEDLSVYFSNYIDEYRQSIHDIMMEPHIILKEIFGTDILLPSLIMNKKYKPNVNIPYIYENRNEFDDNFILSLVGLAFTPIVLVYYLLTTKKGRFLSDLLDLSKKYFPYSLPNKKQEILKKGSFFYQLIEMTKKDYPELSMIPFFKEPKDNYRKDVKELWDTYCKNFNLGE